MVGGQPQWPQLQLTQRHVIRAPYPLAEHASCYFVAHAMLLEAEDRSAIEEMRGGVMGVCTRVYLFAEFGQVRHVRYCMLMTSLQN